jgi:hypothetical protein
VDEALETEFCSKPHDVGEVTFTGEKDTSTSVRDRLIKKCVSYRKSIGASKFIIDIINFGYKINFFDTPVPCMGKKNASARQHHAVICDL